MIMTAAAALTAFLILLIFPDTLAAAALENLRTCGAVIVPSLFVFAVLGELLPVESWLVRAGRSTTSRTVTGLLIFAFGTLCGFPLAARLSSGLHRSGAITRREHSLFCCVCSNVGMGFALGPVREVTEHSLAVYLTVLVSSLVCGAIFLLIIPNLPEHTEVIPGIVNRPCGGTCVTQAVAAASTAMLNICGCVVFFGSLGVVLGEIAGGATIIRGIFEFSSGVIAAKHVAEPLRTFLCCGFMSFGGFSVHAQVSMMTKGDSVSRYFFFFKLLQSAVALFAAFIWMNFVDKPAFVL